MAALKEFKEFALKGSVVDLAVGVVIGTAFGAVVKSLVDEVLMPIAGAFTMGRDLSHRYLILRGHRSLSGNETLAEARASGAAVVGYGQFLNVVLTLLIIAWVVFLIVKVVNRMRRTHAQESSPDPTSRPCPECLTEIPLAATRCKACSTPLESTAPASKSI